MAGLEPWTLWSKVRRRYHSTTAPSSSLVVVDAIVVFVFIVIIIIIITTIIIITGVRQRSIPTTSHGLASSFASQRSHGRPSYELSTACSTDLHPSSSPRSSWSTTSAKEVSPIQYKRYFPFSFKALDIVLHTFGPLKQYHITSIFSVV